MRNQAMNTAEAVKRTDIKADATHALLVMTRSEHSQFREKVASEYVTIKALGDLRTEINDNFKQLDGKLERYTERMLDKS